MIDIIVLAIGVESRGITVLVSRCHWGEILGIIFKVLQGPYGIRVLEALADLACRMEQKWDDATYS